MHKTASLSLALMIFGLGLSAAFSGSSSLAQSSAQESPRPKDFGSSLKRLKWNPVRKAAVEIRSQSKREKVSKPDEEDVVRVETSLVVCDFLVLDKQGRSVHGLTRDDFLLTKDGQPQQVGTFALGDGATIPRSIILIIDYSFSQLGFIKSSVEAAKTLVDKLGPRDRMAIVTDEVRLLADFTQDKAKLKEKLESLNKEFSSRDWLLRNMLKRGAHYSALMAVLKELFSDEDLRPIVIFQAHGNEAPLLQQPIGFPAALPMLSRDEQEEARRFLIKAQQFTLPHRREFSLGDVYAEAEKSRATIYTVIPGFRLVGLSLDERVARIKAWQGRGQSAWDEAVPGGEGPRQFRMKKHWELILEAEGVLEEQMALVELAKRTGGWADFIEEPEQAAAVYSRIFSDVNRRYVIGYYPANKEHNGKRREVKIEVRGHPEYTVWGKKSYYAPGPEE